MLGSQCYLSMEGSKMYIRLEIFGGILLELTKLNGCECFMPP